MKKKKFSQKLFHLFTYIGMYEVFFIFKIFPLSSYRFLSFLLGNFGYYTMRKTRKRIISNLKIAFGNEKTLEEMKKLAKKILIEIILNSMETIYLTLVSKKELLKLVEIDGEEKLHNCLKEKKGAVAVCAHLGNFPLMQARLTIAGFPVKAIIKDSNNPYLARFWQKTRNKMGIPFISKWDIKNAVLQSQYFLKQGEIVCFYLDQHAGNGVKAKMFGKDVFVPRGAATFSRKNRCPVIGLFPYRKKGNRHKIIVEGPYNLKITENPNQDIIENSCFFIKRVEHFVRMYPDQWFSWLHRRFR